MKNCKKLIKKSLCFAILSTLVITMSQPIFSRAEGSTPEEKQKSEKMQEQTNIQYDVTKPVIEKVEFLQQGRTLKEGDTIILKVQAYDADSEIEQVYANGSIENSDSFIMEGVYSEEEECYVCEYTLQNVYGNVLTIDTITVVDQYRNYTNWPTVDPENGSYTFRANLECQRQEEVGINIKKFVFKQNGQKVNEETLLELTLETEEFLEGDCLLANFQYHAFDSKGGSFSIPLQRSETSDKVFVCDGYRIEEDYVWARQEGRWDLSGLYIERDSEMIGLQVNNLDIENYYYLFSNQEKEDTEAPVITDVRLEKNGELLYAGESTHITVRATDNVGLQENCRVVFSATADFLDNMNTIELCYNEKTGAFEGEFSVSDETYPCEWYLSDIFVQDTAGNLADDVCYTRDAKFPYYINVVNGSTHVTPDYDLYIDFLALDQFGNWRIIEQIHKEGVERRQTMQEAGITFPEAESKYPGFTQIGWIDSEGNEITSATQCMNSGYIRAYAEYDKRNIQVQCKFLAEDETVTYEFRNIIVPHNATFAELKKELGKSAPQSTFSGMSFEGWKLESLNGRNVDKHYKDDDQIPKSYTAFVMANAMYGDSNVLNAIYTYPDFSGGVSTKNLPVIYNKGVQYKEMIQELLNYKPENILKEYEFEKWEYDIRSFRSDWAESTVTDESDHLNDAICTAKFKGKTMLPIVQWYYDKNGMWTNSSRALFVDDGTAFDEVMKELESWEVPETCKGAAFQSWNIIPVGAEIPEVAKNGQQINMEAVYDRSPHNPLPPEIVDQPGTTMPGGTDVGGKDESTKQPEGGEEQQEGRLPNKQISQIAGLIEKTEPGIPIQIEMAGATVIPKEILEAAKGKNNEIVLNMGGYSWTVNGTDIAATDLKSIDLKVVMDTDNIPGRIIQALAGDHPVQQLSLVHQGDFGFKATLTVNVGNEHAGKFGNLYYHDSAGKLVFIDAGEIAPGGNVSLTFSHASDYMIVMSNQKMSQANVPDELAPVRKPGGTQPGGDQNQPGSGNKNPSGNGSQSQPGTDTENPSENPASNEQDAAKSQTETTGQTQAASNSQSGAQNKSVQTGDETEAVPLVLASILSLGILICMWTKQRNC